MFSTVTTKDESSPIGNSFRLAFRTLSIGFLIAVAAIALPVVAQTINFEAPTYTVGNINGQDGWTKTNPAFDFAVAPSGGVTGFAAQSLRMSNAVTSGSFGDQTFSPSLANEAGETSAVNGGLSGGVRRSRFIAQWQFTSAVPGAEQPGLIIGASPDRGDGARMSLIRMQDTPTGLEIVFFDYQAALGNSCGSGLNFVSTTVASNLARNAVHTIRIEMDFVDGVQNDIVRVYVNGALAHTGTSWEDYFRDCETNPTRTVDSVLFRSSGTAAPATAGNGFLIDNFVMFSPQTLVVDDDLACPNAAYSTISSAVTAALAGDTISVCPGTYNESPAINKSVNVQSTGGRDVTTIQLDASANGYPYGGMYLSGAGSDITVDGFTIRGVDGTPTVTGTTNFLVGAGLGDVVIKNNRILIAKMDFRVDFDDSQGIASDFNSGTQSLTVENNIIGMVSSGPAWRAYYINPGLSSLVVRGNTISGDFSRTAVSQADTSLIENNVWTGTGTSGGFSMYGLSAIVTGNSVSNVSWGLTIGASNVTATGNSFHNNGTGIDIPGAVTGINVNYNRIVGNTLSGLNVTSATVNAENNWWGCNYGPAVAGVGCPVSPNGITGAGSVDANPWLTLTSSASPLFIPTGGNSTVTSRVTINSAAVETSGSGFIPNGTPASFAATLGTVFPTTNTTTSGVTTTVFTAGGVGGSANVATTVDGQTTDALINVLAACADVSMGVYTPSKNELTNTSIVVPVTVSEMTTRNARSADFTVTYNSAVLTFTGAAKGSVGTSNLDGRDLTINSSTAGVLVISLFGPREFQGAGSLVDLSFNVIGLPGTSSALTFSAFEFNEGTPCSNKTNGAVNVQSGSITGKVTFGNTGTGPFPKVVPDVNVNAAGSVPQSTTTANTGIYTLSGMGTGPYTVTPTKSLDLLIDKPAITGLDASDIAVHVVGNLPQLANNQLIVADVSGNGTITSFDAAMIASFVVDLPDTGFTGTWRFIPVNRFYADVNANYTGQDYVALLMGDVTGNWDHPLGDPFLTMEPVGEPLPISAARASASSGTALTVPVKIGDTTGLGIRAYDFELHYDADVIEPAEAAASFAGTVSDGRVLTVNATKKGILKVVVFGADPLEGEGALLNLHFNVIGAADSRSELKWEKFRLNEGGIHFKADNGEVNVSAAADSGSINGRLLDPRGIGVGRTRVTVTDTQGKSRSVMSSSLGYFQVSELQIGETYTVRAAARRFRFAAQQVSITDGNAVELVMIGLE